MGAFYFPASCNGHSICLSADAQNHVQNMVLDSLHAAGFFDDEIEQGLPVFDPKEREVGIWLPW